MSTSKKKIVKKVRATLALTPAERKAWVQSYETTGKLPNINIPCSKCHQGITAAHGNLRSKVAKYKGIANLLESFVCKSCVKAAQPAKAPRAVRTPRKRRSKEVAPGVVRDVNGRYDIPAINVNAERRAYSIQEIALSAEMTQDLTRGACLQPHIYLNHNSTCDHCPLYTNCSVQAKCLSKAKRKELALA
jgi:hypothetical protein